MPPYQCRQCGTPVPFDDPIPRDSECENCHRDLRCCMNCRHYDTTRNNSCRETEAELVEDKARRNFCEFFAFDRTPFAASKGDTARAAQARAKLESLFGGRPAGSTGPGDARKKLEDLFRKPPAPDD